ncbi:MAG: type IV pilus modification PilV family protein, partial [Bacteroidota bacterium]
MGLLNKTLKGSTLVEVIVAMVIVMLSFGIAIMMIQGTFASHKTRLRMEALFNTNLLMQQTQMNHRYIDETFGFKHYTIQKSVSEYNKEPGMLVITFTVAGEKKHEWFDKRMI